MLKKTFASLLLASMLITPAMAKEYTTNVSLYVEEKEEDLIPGVEIPYGLNYAYGTDSRGNKFPLCYGISVNTNVYKGYMEGRSDNNFAQDAYLTRAEFATILDRVLTFSSNKPVKTFNDTTNHWAKSSIERISSYGIVYGTSENTFSPNDFVTREQVLVMLSRVIYTDHYSSNPSDMMSNPNYNYINVLKLLNSGIYRILPEERNLSSYITRGEMVHLINSIVFTNPTDIGDRDTTLKDSGVYSDLANNNGYTYYNDCVRAINVDKL